MARVVLPVRRWRLAGGLQSPTAQVALACGTIGLIFFGLLAAPFPIWDGQPSGPAPAASSPREAFGWVAVLLAVGFVVTLCLPYRPYSLALSAASRGCVRTWLLVTLTVLLAFVSLMIYPRFGSDIFDYAGFERMWVVYGDNPLTALVNNRPADWGAPFVWYPSRTPAYGPLWALLTWPIVRLASESAGAVVVGYKFLSADAYGLCCWLIWSSVEKARRQRAFILFAWSPLVLFEVLGKVHNDVLPALSMLAMVWLVGRGRGVVAMLAVIAGGLAKPTALAAAPLLAVRLWREGGWRRLVPAALGGLVLISVCYAPFWVGLGTLSPLWQQTSRLGWSPATLLIVASTWLTSRQFDGFAHVVLGLVWASICCLVLTRQRPDRPEELATSSGWLLLATLLLLTSDIFGHYFVPAVALAAVSGDPRLERAVQWLSIGGLAAYGLDLLGPAFDPTWVGSKSYEVVGTLVLLGPAAIAMLRERFEVAYPIPAWEE